jgi:hypothetical protein
MFITKVALPPPPMPEGKLAPQSSQKAGIEAIFTCFIIFFPLLCERNPM